MPRTQIEPRKGDKRYVLRKKGKFTKSQDDAHLLQIAASARSEFEARRRWSRRSPENLNTGTVGHRAFGLAAEAIKRVIRTCRHIKAGWRSPWRVTRLWTAAARNWHAADDGASNLLLLSSGLRMTLMLRRRVGGHHCKCKHNGRNNRNECFHRGPSRGMGDVDTSLVSFCRPRFSAREAIFRHCCATVKRSRRSAGGICWARSSHFSALA